MDVLITRDAIEGALAPFRAEDGRPVLSTTDPIVRDFEGLSTRDPILRACEDLILVADKRGAVELAFAVLALARAHEAGAAPRAVEALVSDPAVRAALDRGMGKGGAA